MPIWSFCSRSTRYRYPPFRRSLILRSMTHTRPQVRPWKPRRGIQHIGTCSALALALGCGVPENTSILDNSLTPGGTSGGSKSNTPIAPAGTSGGGGAGGPSAVGGNTLEPVSSSVQPAQQTPQAAPSTTPAPDTTAAPSMSTGPGETSNEPPFVDGAGLGTVPVGGVPSSSPVTPAMTTPVSEPQPSPTPEATSPTPEPSPMGGLFGGQQPAPVQPAPVAPAPTEPGGGDVGGGDTTNPAPDPVSPGMTDPGGADSWTPVYAIFQEKCAGGFCHGPNQLPPQLVGEESVVIGPAEQRADAIVEVAGVRMPPVNSGFTLTPDELQAISAWAMSL